MSWCGETRQGRGRYQRLLLRLEERVYWSEYSRFQRCIIVFIIILASEIESSSLIRDNFLRHKYFKEWMIHVHLHRCEVLHLTHCVQVIFVLVNQIDVKLFGLKFALKLVSLVHRLIKILITCDILSCAKKFLDNIWIDLSLQYVFDLTRTVFTMHKAWMSPYRLHHLWWHLMQFSATHIVTLMLNFIEKVDELFFSWSDLLSRFFAQMLFNLFECLQLMLIKTREI